MKIASLFKFSLFAAFGLSLLACGEKQNPVDKKETVALKERLTDLQYKVTQKDGTEPPFWNKYWDNKKEGLGEYSQLFNK